MEHDQRPPFLLPDLSATFSRIVASDLAYWRGLLPDRFAGEILDEIPRLSEFEEAVPGDMWRSVALVFHPGLEAEKSSPIFKRVSSQEFFENCLVKLKRQFYGDEDARLPFDPRKEGPHRVAFVRTEAYLHSVLERYEAGISTPFLCSECGIFGDTSLLAFRNRGLRVCLWCSDAFLVIVQRFRIRNPSNPEETSVPRLEAKHEPARRARVFPAQSLTTAAREKNDLVRHSNEFDLSGLRATIRILNDGHLEIVRASEGRIPYDFLLALGKLLRSRVNAATVEIEDGKVYLDGIFKERGGRYLLGRLLRTREGALTLTKY